MDGHQQGLIKILHRDLWLYSSIIAAFTGIAVFQHNLIWLSIAATIGCTYWIGNYFKNDTSIPFPFGLANAITIFRLGMLLATSIFYKILPLPATGLLFVLVATGDILDGWVARVLNRTSVIGEYMDKETDALLVLLGTMIFYMQHMFGIWVIFIGLIRYAYFLVMYFFILPNQKERKDPSAKFIAVLVITSVLLAFFIPTLFSKPLLICSGILLIYSFGRSVLLETGVIK